MDKLDANLLMIGQTVKTAGGLTGEIIDIENGMYRVETSDGKFWHWPEHLFDVGDPAARPYRTIKILIDGNLAHMFVAPVGERFGFEAFII